ncbi:helix-turn-helix domain-containing protein [Saccharicrinis sp. GN24d3]|uniref:helix-turn-helix domain-containing protein n=1 Tax=Saccharicrinis sp. GN24d3 TaxID=3458416 RepID=UPI004036F8A9
MTEEHNTDKIFIDKLTEIVKENLSDEHFGVNELAEKAGFSHSQLHRKLKAITNQSASQFIRGLRLVSAKKILEQELYTAAEIAYKVGFGSPSYFSKCYHDYFGFPPGKFKKHIHENNEDVKNIEEDTTETISHNEPLSTVHTKKKRTSYKKHIAFALGILLILALSFFTYKYFEEEALVVNHTIADKSIAVLPLKILINEEKNLYLADGIMEDILNRLSQIRDLQVKSRISADKYSDTNISLPEIAKELGVSYILEGSLLKNSDRVKIYVRLIEAKSDNHVWSDQYDHDLSDIFEFVSNVSKQVADALKTVLSDEEIEKLDKRYTESEEAYNLYLEGRFHYRLRTEQSFKQSIELYNQALAIDSNYSLAYAGLADSYLTSTWYRFIPPKEGIIKSRAFALKALSFDSNLAQAHTTLGGIATYFTYDYKTAEKELKLALEINPAYVRANKVYSEYLDVIGDSIEARRYINIALEYDPSYHNLIFLSYRYYFRNGNYDKAHIVSNKLVRLDKREKMHFWRNFEINLRKGMDEESIKNLKRFLIADSAKIEPKVIDDLYKEKGIKSIIRFIIENDLVTNDRGRKNYKSARLYAFIGDNKQALHFIEKAFDVHIKYEQDFIHLRSEPEFIALLVKMNLEGY